MISGLIRGEKKVRVFPEWGKNLISDLGGKGMEEGRFFGKGKGDEISEKGVKKKDTLLLHEKKKREVSIVNLEGEASTPNRKKKKHVLAFIEGF